MRLNFHQVEVIRKGLDHPECVNFGPDKRLYAGGISGQIYVMPPPKYELQLLARTAGGYAGVTIDANHNVYACNALEHKVFRVTPKGDYSIYCEAASDGPTIWPNYGLFDSEGNYYFSDSGWDYWKPSGRLIRVSLKKEAQSLIGGNWHFANGLAMSRRDNSIYMIETAAADIVRVPINKDGTVGVPELFVQLQGNELDGLAFAVNGNLYVSCYYPNRIFVVYPDRNIELLIEDTTGDFLNQPTNVAFEPNSTRLFIASLGGTHISALDVGEKGAPLYYPQL
jgi:gluconolactonase